MAVIFANRLAASAGKALIRIKQHLMPCMLRFRIVAPRAGKWAAFEKNRGSYAGSVIDAKALNVENLPLHVLRPPFYQSTAFNSFERDCQDGERTSFSPEGSYVRMRLNLSAFLSPLPKLH